ncbi:hypothetical protein DFAR_2970008 [Desulfarculales bacterium]
MRTYIADSVVADSVPAATAYATSLRTSDKFISLDPDPQRQLPGLPVFEDIALRSPWPRCWKSRDF